MFGPPSRRLSGSRANKDAGPAPHQVLVKGDKAESGKAKGGLPSEGISDTVSGEIKIPPLEDKSEGEANIPSPHGKKRAASEEWEERAPK